MTGKVVAVCRSADHGFSKEVCSEITLLEGLGVEGDAHKGITVQHRSRLVRTPGAPNLRQVHLLHDELFDELRDQGFSLNPGDIGENITTNGIDLLSLATGTELAIGAEAVIQVTGLRNPCSQLDQFQPGLMGAVLDKRENGELVRKAGIMGIVKRSGTVSEGDTIKVHLPDPPHEALVPV